MIIGLVIGLILFGAFYLAFRQGLRMGSQTANGIPPKPLKNPIQAIKDVKVNIEDEKKDELFKEGWGNIMNYTGDVKDERG